MIYPASLINMFAFLFKDITTPKEEEKDEKDESAEEMETAEKAPEPIPKGTVTNIATVCLHEAYKMNQN